ncbi:hypothetical protein EZS27_013646 [termite gut metagenome]|uniref:Uncharacterized protein n=1 Tax=termite gut metagenome TaxID=433724 RepID=A0A5J4RXN9_9ZZZZ
MERQRLPENPLDLSNKVCLSNTHKNEKRKDNGGMGHFKQGTNIGKNHRFTADSQPNKRGRKESLYHSIGAKTGCKLRKKEYFDAIRFIMEQSMPTLKGILKEAKDNPNTKTPIWICTIIESILKDVRYGRTVILNKFFDRIFGKPPGNYRQNKRGRSR